MSCLNFKSSARVVDEQQLETYKTNDSVSTTSLTVWRKSLIHNCNGFTVIDSDGNLVYRVDNYCEHPEEVVLMDSTGKSMFTMTRPKVILQKLSMVEIWRFCEGDDDVVGSCTSKKPVWSVRRKHGKILHANSGVLAYVCRGSSSSKRYAYTIQGSYTKRSCRVLDQSGKMVAEIKNKESRIGGISFGAEVFSLVVQPGFDPGFAMTLVLLLDQMFS